MIPETALVTIPMFASGHFAPPLAELQHSLWVACLILSPADPRVFFRAFATNYNSGNAYEKNYGLNGITAHPSLW